MNTFHLQIVCLIITALTYSNAVFGVTYEWDNDSGDNKWATGANWYSSEADNTPPQGDDNVRLGSFEVGGIPVATSVVDQAGAIAATVYVGYNGNTYGSLYVIDGDLTINGGLKIGYSGTGLLIVSNGSVQVAGALDIAPLAGKPAGRLEIDGGNVLAADLSVGRLSSGTLIQRGGTNEVTGTEYIAFGASSAGTYKMQGGFLSPNLMHVGYNGTGIVEQTGGLIGDIANPKTTYIGYLENSVGTYSLENGTLIMKSLIVGDSGSATFTQTEGTNRVTGICYMARKIAAPSGAYNLQGGVLMIGTNGSTSGRYIFVGEHSKGTFNIGTTNSTGTIQEAPGSANSQMVVRRYSDGEGTVRGWGDCLLTGSLLNNGIVIADGYGTDRDLDFSTLQPKENDIPNTTTNGWYAQNHGRLLLPSFNVVTLPYWGEKTDQDLINSVAFNVSGTGDMNGALLAADHGSVPDGLFNPLGIWEFSASGAPGTGKLTFKYDAVLAGLKENMADVMRYNGSSWEKVTDIDGLDIATDTIRTKTVDPVGIFAVDILPRGTIITIL